MEITAGFTGDLPVAAVGLGKAVTEEASLAAGTVADRPVSIPAGTAVARFDLDAANNAADTDLYVYRVSDAGARTLVGQSATGAPDESVTLTNPAAGNYVAVLDGFSAAPGETGIAYRYDQFTVPATGGAGSFGANPNPVPVIQGQTTTFNAVWSGLPTGRYLGRLSYDGALAPTYVYVDVN